MLWIASRPALPTQGGPSIDYRRGDRLVHFMGNRDSQLAQRRNTRDVCQLGLHAAQRLFGARPHQVDTRLLQMSRAEDIRRLPRAEDVRHLRAVLSTEGDANLRAADGVSGRTSSSVTAARA